MNNIPESGASYETPIPRQPSSDTTRPPVRTVLYNDNAHDDGTVPDPIHEDEDPEEDPDGFIPIDMSGEVDDNRSIHSALSTSSQDGWMNNKNLMTGNYATMSVTDVSASNATLMLRDKT